MDVQITLAEIAEFIDWSPFFAAWELHGKYPAILDDPIVGLEARRVLNDAHSLLSEIIQHRLLSARGVFGFWPVNSDGDTVIVYADDSRRTEIARFEMLRQQWQRKGITHFRSLADYVAPTHSGRKDYIGGFAVTAGHGCEELVKTYRERHDDYSAIMASALADRLAEAFAESLHRIARQEWGFGKSENLTKEELIKERYRGIRPAAGYPACPDHSEKGTLWRLLAVQPAANIRLTESFAMWPAASVSGLYFAHPQARYFAVNKITRDQVEHYSRRKGQSIEETEKWLSPVLGY
jgi:5-methyltetrahydrofolate--homocysteine methyltransferase